MATAPPIIPSDVPIDDPVPTPVDPMPLAPGDPTVPSEWTTPEPRQPGAVASTLIATAMEPT
jgi:hypothetical protein